jgi:hypothetical protein
VRVKKEESQEISEMKQARRSRDRIPAGVREEPGSCRGTLYPDGVGRSHDFLGGLKQHYFGGKCEIWQALVGVPKERQLRAVEGVISDPRSVAWLNLALPTSILRD